MLIAQITDTHIRPKGKPLYHLARTAKSLRRCVAHIEALTPRPDLVVATGDLADRGKSKEYRRLRKILAGFSMPVFLIPGNHDVRDGLREHFPDHGYLPSRGPLCYAVETLPVRLIGLDTTRSKHPGGELDDARLDWFERTLASAPTRPTFVFMHHPPFTLGIAPVDAQGFRNADRFATIVARHPQIVRIACGHIHRVASASIGGTLAISAPSTAHQLTLRRAPLGIYGVHLESPAYALHRWDGVEMHSIVHATDAAGALVARLRRVS